MFQFIAQLRQQILSWRIDREINSRIAPHIHQEANHGYPFDSPHGLCKQAMRDHLTIELAIRKIEDDAEKMGKASGHAFRHIVYRDLLERLDLYQSHLDRRIQPNAIDRKLVARHA